MSQMSDDSGAENREPPRRDSPNNSSPSPVSTSRPRVRRFVESDSDSDSGSSLELHSRKRRVPRVKSDDSDSSGSVIIKRFKGTPRLVSESEGSSDDGFADSSASQWETDNSDDENTAAKPKIQDAGVDSDSSDGQSEKCPICLLSFSTQEVGTPESCDHAFCVACIQEWAKNVNTCPVDRQEFRLILVRKSLNGKIHRQIPIEPPQPQNDVDIVEDPTFCEICGSSDREDRMLLCDGCDLGFHLECLTPPLQDVPVGGWFCNDCSPEDVVDPEIELLELQVLLDDAFEMGMRPMPRPRRLVPRTRYSERVLRRIASNRTQEASESLPTVSSTSTTRRKKKRKRKRKNQRIVYKIDEVTGETVAVKKRRKKRKKRTLQPPKTVKKRLAMQLGICRPRNVPQNLPDVRVPQNHNSIHNQRYNAGIPTLHLFGPREELAALDSFSDEDESEIGNVLTRRAPNRRDVALLRRSRVKNMVNIPSATVSSSSDILGDILDCQAKFHAKNSKLSLGKDGKITVESPKNVDVNNSNHQEIIRQRPANYSNNDSMPSSSGTQDQQQQQQDNSTPTSTVETNNTQSSNSNSSQHQDYSDTPQDYTQRNLSAIYEQEEKAKEKSRSATPISGDSEIDIYSDIETVSTSKVDETDPRSESPQQTQTPVTEDDNGNDSEPDMVIDTEKPEPEESVKEEVSSTVNADQQNLAVSSTSDLVESSTSRLSDKDDVDDDDESEDGCPNFSIYSKESITLAKNTDITLPDDKNDDAEEISSSPAIEVGEIVDDAAKNKNNSGLYSDSEDETVVKKGIENSFGISDIANMTEDISEEERSYTPCLDERVPVRQGIEGLDTEMISDEDRNDFDESHDLKTASDGGDALEINAKESELDFTRPEDYEEGEIVDKSKTKKKPNDDDVLKENQDSNNVAAAQQTHKDDDASKKNAKKRDDNKDKDKDKDKDKNKDESAAFKKLSRSNKERNYRSGDKSRSRSRDKKDKDKEKEKEKQRTENKKREKRKEIERYNVRALIAEKPRRQKDEFGRDIRRTPSRSRSRTRSRSKNRRSRSKKRRRSRRRSLSRSRSPKKPRRLSTRKRRRSRTRTRSPSPAPKFRRRKSREWTPSLSRSRSPDVRHFTPSWTPPRMLENTVKGHGLTVILTNDANKSKKKKEKRKAEKKGKDSDKQKKKRQRNDRTPPPSKEVFASGDNILVSVSFNKENETRDVSTKKKRDALEEKKKQSKEKRVKNRLRRQPAKDLSGVKPVAIIDLERSPFKELTPSPKDVIVLSDSDAEEARRDVDKNAVCDSSEQVASPERCITGPKTPPEPQVKFTLTSKPPQMRAISNPLHEPEDIEQEETHHEDDVHKGPNTPPEPPNSPPSSPDAYDPFEPTKSRSPTPEIVTNQQTNNQTLATSSLNLDHLEITNENLVSTDTEKSSNNLITQTPDALNLKSHTPPLTLDVQPADSQSSIQATPESGKSPERSASGSLINQSVQTQTITAKPVAQTTPFSSSVATSIITSTPVSNLAPPRISILSSTILTPSIPQRIVLPNTTVKSSPVKISPTKSTAIKATPIKPMPVKSLRKSSSTNSSKNNQNGANDPGVESLSLDSPYSPGSSDYEDLFEPPSESAAKPTPKPASKAAKSPAKIQNAFDALFGSPFNKIKPKSDKAAKYGKKSGISGSGKGTKQVGVKLDEDNLKILDELPNSAVEMQVKDKFLKKLNRQERVVEEVKLVLKPHYNKKHINKEEYKDILRRAVPKICHNKSGEINPTKIKNLIEAYVKKVRHSKKVTSSSSVNTQKA